MRRRAEIALRDLACKAAVSDLYRVSPVILPDQMQAIEAICRIKKGIRKPGAQSDGRPFIPEDWTEPFTATNSFFGSGA